MLPWYRMVWCAGVLAGGAAVLGQIAEVHVLYAAAGPRQGLVLAPWNMLAETRLGGTREGGRCLWFNTDWKAQPWAGVRFESEQEDLFVLTPEWIERGFIRLHLNVTVDRYGNIGGGDAFQLKPIAVPALDRYQRLRAQHIDRGRGIDEETDTWQEVLVPLRYFTELAPGHRVRGLSFQTVDQVQRVFSLDEVGFVRFETLPTWMVEQSQEKVVQPWVEWPAYAELPAGLRADRAAPRVRDGRFVTADGQRAFLLSPYCTEDSRAGYGCSDPSKLPSTFDLYDREKHGWIYDRVPDDETLCRLGFNSISVTPVPTPWWQAVGYGKRYGSGDPAFLGELARRVSLPFYVDLVSWPWTLGEPGLKVAETDLPAAAATVGRNHWTQYRITGAGREAWLTLWRVMAQRYRDAGVRTVILELMNEPAYMGESPDHHEAFAEWLSRRYGTLEQLNTTWSTAYPSWEDASRYRFAYGDAAPPAGQALDYDEFLSEAFTDLIGEGVRSVRDILPDALVGLQPMGGYLRSPREAVWKHRIARHESVVLTPTGGGRWTAGGGRAAPASPLVAHGMADAPLENDLLLAVAGSKMIVDNETYLRGQTRQETRDRLWEHVLCGVDGLTVFSWSKRGWVWWKDRAAVQVDADKYPYSSLIPLARRTDALRGILDFSIEMRELADTILPKPWGPVPRIGVLYGWANARRRVVEPELFDKTGAYYAALRYSHWCMGMVPSDAAIEGGVPEGMDVLVAGGQTHAEPELLDRLRAFVEAGGTLIVGEGCLDRDVHGRTLDTASLLGGVRSADPGDEAEETVLRLPEDGGIPIGGEVVLRGPGPAFAPGPATEVVFADAAGRAVVTRHSLGRGHVYFQGGDVLGYPLSKVLWAILRHAAAGEIPASWRAAEIRQAGGELAANVLLSRRSYGNRHAFLLHNRDRYDRDIRLSVPGLTGQWQAREALSHRDLGRIDGAVLANAGVALPLKAGSHAILVLESP
ncbi:MAG: beta-galactosidase [Lentisphaeria bacterium]|nr:beta-galactosidase [Lentisphaeria bacterium]